MTQFARYYERELARFHEASRSFAERHPASAGLLRERSSDPDVERLIEAFAFQIAGIRERMDAMLPTIVQNLAELLLPHYVRPLPTTTIVEFTPNLRSLRASHRIAPGKELVARPRSGTKCRFRTCFAVDLLPLELVDVRLDTAVEARPVIEVRMRLGLGPSTLRECSRVRFFLHHGEPSLPAMLVLWFARHLAGISVRPAAGGSPVPLPDAAVELSGLSPELSVFPWPETAPSGFRLLLEYFTLPERFHFIDLCGLERANIEGDELVVSFAFDRPPAPSTALGRENFRLHCTPAINLFENAAETVQYTPLEREHLLRADSVEPRHMEVYAVRSASGIGRIDGVRREFKPFHEFANLGAHTGPSYVLRRSQAVDAGVDVAIVLDEARGAPLPTQAEVLSIELTCTNRHLAGELAVGDLAGTASGMYRGYTNITPMTPTVRAPTDAEGLWRLLSHLAVGQRGLVDADALRRMLGLYNLQGPGDMQRGRVNEQQIAAISRLRQEMVTRLLDGVPIRARRTHVELDEKAFPGPGNAYIFGGVLHELGKSLADINLASELAITLKASRQEYLWPIRS